MADGSSSKGFAKVLNKKLFRTKEKVLQNLGKADKTTDDAFDEHVQNFQKQQTSATKLQKELKNYISCVKAMSVASKSFYDSLKDTYESEWTGYTELISAVEHLSILWDDYLRKLTDDVQTPLNTYICKFPDTRNKISKRGRKLVDYDSTRHHLDATQNAKKRDEGKVMKAQEEMDDARRIYEELNNELHEDLPTFYQSRINFYANNFNALFQAEGKFQEESAKIKSSLVDATDRLGRECENTGDKVYTPKRPDSQRSQAESDEAEKNVGEGPGLSKFYNVAIPNDVASDRESENERRSMSAASSVESDMDAEPSPKENHKDIVSFPVRNGEVEEKPSEKRKSQEQTYEPVTVGAQQDKRQSQISKSEPPARMDEKPGYDDDDDDDDRFEDDEGSAPPINNNKDGDGVYAVAGDTEDIYKVPTSNEPVEQPAPDDPNENQLYKVKATHSYNGEDMDELTFDAGEIIRVIPFEDPEDQDEGWLMGVKESTNQKGVFPANFTKKIK